MKVIKFGANWCGPCKVLDKRLENFTDLPVVKYDVDELSEEMLQKYNIVNIPVTILFDDEDNEIRRWIGAFNIQQLKDEISKRRSDIQGVS